MARLLDKGYYMCEVTLRDKLIGALIGLARATDGSEHLITPSATAVVIESLTATQSDRQADDQVLEALLSRVDEEKQKMVPDCFLCANPCGRTSAYDLRWLQRADADVRALKSRILNAIHCLAASAPKNCDDKIFYKALVVVGMDDYTAADLLPVVLGVEELASACQ